MLLAANVVSNRGVTPAVARQQGRRQKIGATWAKSSLGIFLGKILAKKALLGHLRLVCGRQLSLGVFARPGAEEWSPRRVTFRFSSPCRLSSLNILASKTFFNVSGIQADIGKTPSMRGPWDTHEHISIHLSAGLGIARCSPRAELPELTLSDEAGVYCAAKIKIDSGAIVDLIKKEMIPELLCAGLLAYTNLPS